jgi:hypothetical protein
MSFFPRLVVGLLNSFRVFHITTKSIVVNSYSCFSSFGSLCHSIPHFQKKAAGAFARFVPVLGGCQLSKYQLELVLDLLKTLATKPDLDIRVWKRLAFG